MGNKIEMDRQDLYRQNEIIKRIRQNNDIEYYKTSKQKYSKVVTYGCQQNNADSEILMGMLRDMGYKSTDDNEEADIILFNTCCVRENAELKLYGNIGALKSLKKEKPQLIIGVCGCMMQQEHAVKMIEKKYRHVDIIFGTHNIYKFPEILEKSLNENHTLTEIESSEGIIVENLPMERQEKHKSWVSIMYGCNNFCSYCIVPYVRGRERSRRPEDIISEIKSLAENGFKEVTLLGQNVNSYGKDFENSYDFADLIYAVNEIRGIRRIRFMTSHPKDISDKLIYAMKECKKVCEHLHLPFQSGSNKILKAMNRKYTKEGYLKIIEKVKNEIPGIALTTDIIVGFPGETKEDFEETIDIVKQVEFDQAFTFIYSKRKGTPAAEMKDVISYEEKHENFIRLLEVQNKISKKISEGYKNKVVEVLIDGASKTNPERLTGKTRTNKTVNFTSTRGKIGDIVPVRITEVFSWSLNGEEIYSGDV